MTTFHDSPLPSRRAARQSEREKASDVHQPGDAYPHAGHDAQPTDGFTHFPSRETDDNSVARPQEQPLASSENQASADNRANGD
ncbi:MAG: hypothetical protein ACOH1K_06010, partial [Rhodoglobus sp.]